MLGILPYTFSSAYRLYINETLVASNGLPGTNASAEVGEYRPQAVIFSTPGSEFDMIIQVSNYHWSNIFKRAR